MCGPDTQILLQKYTLKTLGEGQTPVIVGTPSGDDPNVPRLCEAASTVYYRDTQK